MREQEIIRQLSKLRGVNAPADSFLHTCRARVLRDTLSLETHAQSAQKGGFTRFLSAHILPHTMPLSAGIALVLMLVVGTGFLASYATPKNHLLYQVGSSINELRVAFYPQDEKQALEVKLLAQGVQDLSSVNNNRAYSPAAVETVVGVVEGRFARVAGHLQGLSTHTKEYPFVLLVDTTRSADITAQTLVQLKQNAPSGLQPRLSDALNTVARTKRAALAVMVTFTDKQGNDPEVKKIVEEALGKELSTVQVSLGALSGKEGVGDDVLAAAGEALAQAEKELRGGNYQVTLAFINEAEQIVEGSGEARGKGIVEGESIDVSNAFSPTNTSEYDTTTDVMIGNVDLPEDSGVSEYRGVVPAASSTVRNIYNFKDNNNKNSETQKETKEPEEFPVGFDL